LKRLPRSGLILLIIGLTPHAACVQPPADQYQILFGDSEARLSADEMASAFSAYSDGLTISTDGLRLEDPNCGDLTPSVEIVDLNKDGVQEIFVQWGNACTSGMTGRSLTLLIKDPAGDYHRQFGFPAADWVPVAMGEDDWPDLMLGGPGFCHPVWTFRAGAYDFRCNRPDSLGGCALREDVCDNA
jgi:hypothetical protein